jgi:HEAT repeat protein
MHARLLPKPKRRPGTRVVQLGRAVVLLLPLALLLTSSVRATGEHAGILWLGTLFQGLACALAFLGRTRVWESIGSVAIMLYVIATGWLLLGATGLDDWFLHVALAVFLVVPLLLFAAQCLRESGAPDLRRARQLAQRLATRPDWPADLQACRLMPEVKALRECLHLDASPALALLSHIRPQVRVAALAALEFRPTWRWGQAQTVLHVAQRIQEPEVRAAAIYALANTEDSLVVEGLAEFLYDPSHLVREAATEALLWDTERRWTLIRLAVRHALADPVCQDDGPLRQEGHQLTPEAVDDLTAWAHEKGLLSLRAAQTLGLHYSQALAAGHDPDLVEDLCHQLLDPHGAAMLRLEIARLLHHHRELDRDMLLQLLAPSAPAPVRLIAVDALLSQGPSVEATAVLHDLARLPNREIALATAEIVQRRLGVDLGLPRKQPLPPIQSRLAADVARRVLHWASQQDAPAAEADSRSYSEM